MGGAAATTAGAAGLEESLTPLRGRLETAGSTPPGGPAMMEGQTLSGHTDEIQGAAPETRNRERTGPGWGPREPPHR